MESLPFKYEKREFWVFFCPICKRERRSFYWPSPRKKHYVALFLTAVILTAGLWNRFSFKGAFLIFPVWAVFEFIYRFKARQSLICPHCGFDPYLYKYDVKLAKEGVARFFAEKEKNKKNSSSGTI